MVPQEKIAAIMETGLYAASGRGQQKPIVIAVTDKVLLDELWEFVEQFNADMVILWEHQSCKALNGMHGQFEEKAREKGIPLVWVGHDLFDPRIVSRQGVRDQINNFMRTVMNEEPIDPSLENLPDEKSW
jgi:hypothetical protein